MRIRQRFRRTAAALGVCALLLANIPAAGEAATAEDMTATSTLILSARAEQRKLMTDRKVTTSWDSPKGESLRIQAGSEIGGLYLLWEKEPARWTLRRTGENAVLRQNSGYFLHEYIPLRGAGTDITLEFPDGGSVSEIYVLSTGQCPDWVQRWGPMYEKADMLVYSTHADDEHLWFGGTMPVYAGEYKKKVQVAYLIRHGKARNEYMRTHELLDGLWAVGITAYPMISDFEDYWAGSLGRAKEIYDEEDILAYSVMLLRRFKPDVVIGHDLHGEYGHGVHMLCAESLTKAIPLAADASYSPRTAAGYGTWQIQKCYLHLYEENQVIMDWDVPLEAFGGKTGFEMAKIGYSYHSSQQQKWFAVKQEGDYDCRKFGLYYTAVGPDTGKNDFFENVRPAEKPAGPAPLEPAVPDTPNVPDDSMVEPVVNPGDVPDTAPGTVQPVPAAKSGWWVYLLIGFAVLVLAGGTAVLLLLRRQHRRSARHFKIE